MNSASSVLLSDVLTPTDEGFDSDPIYTASYPRCPTLKLCATAPPMWSTPEYRSP